MTRVAVTSKSFSRDDFLRAAILRLYPDTKFNDEQLRFDDAGLIEFLDGIERVIIGLESITENVLSALPSLKVISKYGVGIDALDLDAMALHGVNLGWTPGVNKRSVTELVVAQSIAVLRDLYQSNIDVKTGNWRVRKSHQLSSRVFGIVGLGHVGQDLTNLLAPFGCRIVAHDIVDMSEFAIANDVTMMPLDELLQTADIVSIHTPLDSSTRHLINQQKIGLMRSDALLINYARGGIVDQKALVKALDNGAIGAAILDVFDEEPPRDPDLLAHPKLFASGHIGGSSFEAIRAMGLAAIDGLESHSQPQGVSATIKAR